MLFRSYDSLIPDLNWRQQFELDEEIEIDSEDVTNISSVEFHNLCQDLKDKINNWLNSLTFLNLEQKLRTKLHSTEEIQVIIQTDLDEVRRLPWNLWDFFDDYPNAVLCLSKPDFERLQNNYRPRNGKIRILAVLGNSENIDIQEDRLILENLPGAETTFLVEAERQELDLMLWDERGWDILFFAGHSKSLHDNSIGSFVLNQREKPLSIDELKAEGDWAILQKYCGFEFDDTSPKLKARTEYENILYLERPGCNLCMGNQEKAAKGDTVLATSTRLFKGRVVEDTDEKAGESLLASTPVVVLSAILGRTPTVEEYKAAVEGIDRKSVV